MADSVKIRTAPSEGGCGLGTDNNLELSNPVPMTLSDQAGTAAELSRPRGFPELGSSEPELQIAVVRTRLEAKSYKLLSGETSPAKGRSSPHS